MWRRFAVIAVCLTLGVPAASAALSALASIDGADSPALTAADALRAQMRSLAEAQGIPWASVEAAQFTQQTLYPNGTVATRQQGLEDVLADILMGTLLTTSGQTTPGVGDITLGNTFHAYVNAAPGSAFAYHVSDSALAPATPAIMPGLIAPIIFEAGGPLRQIKGTYDVGQHTAGTVFGSSVSVGGSGLVVPLVQGAQMRDTSVDFVGHALVTQAQTCTLQGCVAVGGFLGSGIAHWDAKSVPFPTGGGFTPAIPMLP